MNQKHPHRLFHPSSFRLHPWRGAGALLVGVIFFLSSVGYGQELKDEPLAIKAENPAGDSAEGGEKSSQHSALSSQPSFWEKIPPVRVFPLLGNYPIAPTGFGYYSLLDCWRGDYRQAPPKFPYPRFGLMAFPFFDADFRYLESPKNQEFDWSDPFHRMHIGDHWLLNTGGEFRWSYQNYANFNLSGKDDFKQLLRSRVYGDVWFQDRFRMYAEFLDAESVAHSLAPGPLDVDHGDFLNLFFDVRIGELGGKPAYVRVGRQELLLGSERLISPLDFANTLRTFQGVRGFRQGDKFDVDVFWLQPVIPSPGHFDRVDERVHFAGWWNTYRPQKGHFLDVYYLFLSNQNKINKLGIDQAPFDVSTVGGRWTGEKNNWLWDFEPMLQFGQVNSQSDFSGAATAGGGYHFKDCCWNPTLWGYFDYASGTNNPGAGSESTFNELFPFGHYYLGWADLVGRRNIFDANAHLWFYPANWITVWAAYHHFWLATPKDALYNAAGVPIRRDATGKAGSDVGHEIDLIVNFTMSKHQNVLVSFDQFWGGRFVRDTGDPIAGGRPNANTLYIFYDFRW